MIQEMYKKGHIPKVMPRNTNKQQLEQYLECDRFPGRRWDLDSCWSSEKDGKHYWMDAEEKWLRK